MSIRGGRFVAGLLALVCIGLAGGGSAGAAAPSNDNLANAIVLTASGGTLTTDNTGATTEVGEPDKAGDRGGASLWYSWTPDFDGVATIDTSGSSIDTLLGAFIDWPGGTFGLSGVASNDDIGDADTTSRVCTFVSANTTTFRIAVDGYDGETGPITLHWGKKTDSAPCPMIPPTVGGASPPKVGDQLFFGAANFVDGGGSGLIQWLRCVEQGCVAIDGATTGSYTVTSQDVGWAIRVDAKVTNAGGSAHNTSDPTGVVATTPHTDTNGLIFWATEREAVGAPTIHSMLDDTSSESRLTDPGRTQPAVSPDGTQVAFVTAGDIAVMNADGSEPVDLGVPGNSPTWSPDGSRIAFVGGLGIEEVAVADPSDVIVLVPIAGGLTGGSIDWSPDGTKIAYGYRLPGGANVGLAVAHADGRGAITQLTDPTVEDDRNPSWSPDGSRILFSRTCGAVCSGLWVMDAGGGNMAQLVSLGTNESLDGADWSPDGSSIVFSRRDTVSNNSDLFRIPAAGGAATQLTTDPRRDDWPTWGRLASFELTVSRSGNGTGTITSSTGGISCGAVCRATYIYPTSVTLTATPAAGSTFAGWTGDCNGPDPCTVSMSGPHSVGAAFFPTVSTGAGGGGGGGGGGGSSSLALSVTPASQTVASGAAASWTISVTNSGGAYLYAVGVRSSAGNCGIPSSFADTAALMPPGVTISYSCSLSGVTANLTNTVVAGATTGPGDALTQSATATVSVQAPSTPTPAPPISPPPPRAPAAVQQITGTNRADHLIGTPGADVINGLGGNDSINGGKGNDILNGGAGNDSIVGGPGHDTISGGPGNDLITSRDGVEDTVDCGPGRDVVAADKADKVGRNCEVVHRS